MSNTELLDRLQTGHPVTPGRYQLWLNGVMIWLRVSQSGDVTYATR